MIEEKIKIGIDLDDTIWEFHAKFFEWYNDKYDTNYNLENFTEYNAGNFLGITQDELQIIFLDFEKDERYKILPSLKNAKESLFKLKENFEIYFVTARPVFYDELIKLRLKEVFELDLPIFYQYDENRNKIKEKVDFCKEVGISIMIDDAIHNLIPMVESGIKCYLLDYPWNRIDGLSEKIIRVKNWDEILSLLEVEYVN